MRHPAAGHAVVVLPVRGRTGAPPVLGLGLHVAWMLCRRQGGDLRPLRNAGGCSFEIVL